MASTREQSRMRRSNELIVEAFGTVGSVLELGCGEGHQSVWLSQLGESLIGLDVSGRAIARARQRHPQGTYYVSDLQSYAQAHPTPLDLVTACEVLYYVGDVADTVRRMRSVARKCFVTYYHGQYELELDRQLSVIPGLQHEQFTFEGITWTSAWWTNGTIAEEQPR